MTDDSIEHIVAERLDRIFGDDDEDEGIRKPAAETEKSAIDPVRQAALQLEKGVWPESIGRLTSSINSLQRIRSNDPLFLPLLKMMSLLAGHLHPGRPDLNRAVLKSLRSNIACMESLETGRALPDAEKRKLVQKEIESFKVFRDAALTSKPPAPLQSPAAHTPPKGEETASPVPEPPSVEPAAKAAPSRPTPEPQYREKDSASPVVQSQELAALREELSALRISVEGIIKNTEAQSTFGTELRDTMSQIGKQVGALSSMPGAMRVLLKKAMEKPPSKTEEPAVKPINIEDVRSCVKEAMKEGLNAGLKDVREIPSGLREVQEALSVALNGFEKRINELNEELRSVQEGLQAIRSDVNNFRIQELPEEVPAEVSVQPEEAEPETAAEEYEHAEPIGEPAQIPADDIPPARPGLPTGGYFLFSAGGKKYAVDEQYVVKASEAAAGLLKKARIRGGLTISDSSSGLFGTKKGIEPPWHSMTSGEIKRAVFRLVSQDILDGLEDTSGEGVLYLGAGDERILLFTDHPAVKITLEQGDEVQMSGAGDSRPGPVCGSIQRSGEQSEFYLLVSPEKLA